MSKISTNLKFFLDLAKLQSVLSRRFDNGLGGLAMNEFMILLTLSQAEDQKMRRIDLAEKIGLTASGVTRLLLPMEKIGLVKKEVNKEDARVSYVMLAAGGRNQLQEGLERAELLSDDLLPAKTKKLEELADLLAELTGSIR
jgi:DNA-binding MarR family transcriptional regulator